MDPRPTFRSHYRPRTSTGRALVALFLALFVLCMPPVTHAVLDRPALQLAGVPFLYWALLWVYVVLIVVLVVAYRRDL